MNTYYLYINTDDLNRFLLKNLIFPHNKSFLEARTFSLLKDNLLILSRKKYKSDDVDKICSDFFNSSLVLEVILPSKLDNIVFEDDEFLIINDIISFSNVIRVFPISEMFLIPFYNDRYLFNSLVSDKMFTDNNDSLDLNRLDKISLNEVEDLSVRLNNLSKVQAFYCARFGLYLKENTKNKKVISSINIDLGSFKYISDLSYEEFINNYYCKNKKTNKKAKSSYKLIDTTFLNDNFEKFIKNVINNDSINGIYNELYEVLIQLQNQNLIDALSTHPIFTNSLEIINSIPLNLITNISFLRKFFNEIKDDKISITIFILSRILEMDIDRAKLYINNFFEQSEFEKELLSMYGLAKGMDAITISIKQKPDILLFAYNKTKSLFNNCIETINDFNEYYKLRNYNPSIIMKYGFDLKIYDFNEEYKYINNKLAAYILKKYPLDIKSISTKIVKQTKKEEIHDLFLIMKKEEINEL